MSLLNNGYWNEKYFAENYWNDDYWQSFGVPCSAFLLLSLTQGFPLKVALQNEELFNIALAQEVL